MILQTLAAKTFYAIQEKLFGKSTRDMNPLDFWFHNNPEYTQIFTQDFEALCKNLRAYKNMNDVVETAQSFWGNNWLNNTGVLTALHGVEKSMLIVSPEKP